MDNEIEDVTAEIAKRGATMEPPRLAEKPKKGCCAFHRGTEREGAIQFLIVFDHAAWIAPRKVIKITRL